jgi:hypothetical protein
MNALSRRRGTSSSKATVEKGRGRERNERFIVLLLIATFLVLVYRQLMMTGAEMQPDVSSPMDYEHEGYALQGFLALPDGSEIAHAQSPAVIIVP